MSRYPATRENVEPSVWTHVLSNADLKYYCLLISCFGIYKMLCPVSHTLHSSCLCDSISPPANCPGAVSSILLEVLQSRAYLFLWYLHSFTYPVSPLTTCHVNYFRSFKTHFRNDLFHDVFLTLLSPLAHSGEMGHIFSFPLP